MRVVHLACVAPPTIGGIGSNAAAEVAGLRSRGVDAQLVAPTSTVTDEPQSRIRSFIQTVEPRYRFGNAAVLSGIASLVAGADVIHLHYPFYGTAEPLLLQSDKLPPIVMTFHMDATAPGWKGLIFWLHRLFVQPFLLSHAKRILVSSFDYTRQSSLRSRFVRHPKQILEVPFGVDTEYFCPGFVNRERFSLPSDAPVVLFVGGLDQAHAFKGVHELLHATSRLPSDVRLLIVGDGDLRQTYEEEAKALGIWKRVHFLGRADKETLRDAYRVATVFAFPSTNRAEAFGLAALEAEACGIPVIASALPGVRTVVAHGETGLLVPPKDIDGLTAAILTVLSDPSRRKEMGERARERAVKFFSWQHHLDRLEEIYRDVCA